jgi:hypothetical protein
VRHDDFQFKNYRHGYEEIDGFEDGLLRRETGGYEER